MKHNVIGSLGRLCCALAMSLASLVKADSVIDTIHHPYFLPQGQELEWRIVTRHDHIENELFQRIGYSHAVNDSLLLGAALTGERDIRKEFGIAAYHLNALWKLTEQGQYWADHGLLVDVEKTHKQNEYEANIGLLTEKQWGQHIVTSNVLLKHLFGNSRARDTEIEYRLQWQYRLKTTFQPTLEMYSDRDYFGVGPGFSGFVKYSPTRQLRYEMSFINGFNGTEDFAYRARVQFTF
jgi:hypothetical protein